MAAPTLSRAKFKFKIVTTMHAKTPNHYARFTCGQISIYKLACKDMLTS